MICDCNAVHFGAASATNSHVQLYFLIYVSIASNSLGNEELLELTS